MTLDEKLAAIAAAVEAHLGERTERLDNTAGELGYAVAPSDLVECCRILRDTEGLQFEMLMDVCGVDYLSYGRAEWDTASATTTGFSRGVLERGDPGGGDPATDSPGAGEALAETDYQPPSRFAVVYHLLSIANNVRLRLKVACEDNDRPIVDSVTDVWASADWFEREAFDLFGILFVGHPDLRRLLTDYGFIGHPFRKDFPLIGKSEVRYDPKKGRVVYEPVSIEPRTLVPKAIRDDNRYQPDLGKD